MKKIILATFALLGVMSVNAQKNSILLGTDFSYNRDDNKGFNNVKANEFTFSPIIAYEVANNWFVGAKTSLSYSESSEKTTDASSLVTVKNKTKNYTTKVGGFVRYYHPFSETFGIYGDLGAGYQQYRSDVTVRDYSTGLTSDTPSERAREYGYYIDFVPALFINFKNNFGLNVSFGGVEWNDTKTNTASDYKNYSKSKDFDFNFGKSIKVGVTKKFSF